MPDEPQSTGGADGLIAFLDRLTRRLKVEVHTLWLVFRHRETPWLAKAVLILLLAYLASPIDLIPDVIPILGILDDLVVAAVALWLAYRLTPPHVMEECRARARCCRRRPHRLAHGAVAETHGARTFRPRALRAPPAGGRPGGASAAIPH